MTLRRHKMLAWVGATVAASVVFLACGSRSNYNPASPSSTASDTRTDIVQDVSLSVPSTWTIQRNSPQQAVVSNVGLVSDMEAAASNEAVFRVRTLSGVNPEQRAIDQWFTNYYRSGFDGPIRSKSGVSIDGLPALSVDVSASGEWHLTYIATGADVIVVSYSTADQRFLSQYQAILQSLKIVR